MLRGYRIVDADAHVIEPLDIWPRYVAAEFRDAAPRPSEALDPHLVLLAYRGEKTNFRLPTRLKGQWIDQWRTHYRRALSASFDAESQLVSMREMGIDVSFIYPTHGTFLLGLDDMDPALSAALATAYNTWLHEFCAHDPQVLRGVGAISRHVPEAMVPELRRVHGFGWKAVCLLPNPIRGRTLADPAYEPFWAECEQLGMAVGVHTATHLRAPTAGADRFTSRFGMHSCSHPMEQMMAFVALLEGGVMERHPTLRVAFLEAGCGWVPYWLWRLDENYSQLQWEIGGTLSMKPSEYFRRQCFVGVEPDEPYLREVITLLGEDKLLLGSDYPHADHPPDMEHKIVSLEGQLPRTVVQKILCDNSSRFYGLEV